VKLYCMVGLPTETDEDVRGIYEMGRACSDLGRKIDRRPKSVTVSVSNFVPKPHTPFQWHPMPVKEELRRRGQIVRDGAAGNRQVKVRVHDVDRSLLEGVLCRGDRRVGAAVLEAFRLGARFDAWDERYRPDIWAEAFRNSGVDPAWINHRERGYDEWLPWDHVKGGVKRAYHVAEMDKANRGETTGFCMLEKCNKCGIDVKECGPAIRVFKKLPSRRDGRGVVAAAPVPTVVPAEDGIPV
jgi:hypothetical protein